MKARQREGLTLALLALLAVALFEGFSPLDVAISGLFYLGDGHFSTWQMGWVKVVHHAIPTLTKALFALALVATLWGLRNKAAMPRWLWRRSAALALCLALGLGFTVNFALKEGWGRPRPNMIEQFGGSHAFVPALHPVGHCATNCSFVSGHAASGFALLAIGIFGPRRTRRRWVAVGAAAGFAIGFMRVAMGGHFASDILFGLVVMWSVCMLIRECWLRARLRRRRAALALPISQG